MKIECFLVLGKKRGSTLPTVRRTTVRRPALDHDEALVKLVLDLPADIFDAPLLTVPVERKKIAVAVEVDDVLEPLDLEREA